MILGVTGVIMYGLHYANIMAFSEK